MSDPHPLVAHVEAAQSALQNGSSAENVLTEFFAKLLSFFKSTVEPVVQVAEGAANVVATIDPAVAPAIAAGEGVASAVEGVVNAA
jgi:hypothetical protein